MCVGEILFWSMDSAIGYASCSVIYRHNTNKYVSREIDDLNLKIYGEGANALQGKISFGRNLLLQSYICIYVCGELSAKGDLSGNSFAPISYIYIFFLDNRI